MYEASELFGSYTPNAGTWDEMRGWDSIREPYKAVYRQLQKFGADLLLKKAQLAGKLLMNQGITVTVYSDNEGIERIFPFDIIPRIITGEEWQKIEKGIAQRLKALNLFLKDIYSKHQILNDKIVPPELIASCPHFTREVFGIKVPYDIYVHISGIDLIRGDDGKQGGNQTHFSQHTGIESCPWCKQLSADAA